MSLSNVLPSSCSVVHASGLQCQLDDALHEQHKGVVFVDGSIWVVTFTKERSHLWREDSHHPFLWAPGTIPEYWRKIAEEWHEKQFCGANLLHEGRQVAERKSILNDHAERNACFYALFTWSRARPLYDPRARAPLDVFDFLHGWIAHCNHVSLDDAMDAREKHPILDSGRFDPESFAHGHCARANWAATCESKGASNGA